MGDERQTGTAGDGTHYTLAGTCGRVVALVHGLGLTRAMWDWQVPALTPRYRVLTYDLLGHGDSPAPTAQPDLSVFARQLLHLADEIGVGQIAIAGFSLGGMIARRFAMDYPGRVWALAILHSAHRRDPAAQAAIEARVEQARRDGPAATVDAALERWFTRAFRARNPDTVEQVRRWIMANDPAIYPLNYRVLASGVDELVAPDPPINCPALVMTGSADHGNSPAMTRAIAAEIPGARTCILPGLRHLAMIEAPEAFNAPLIDFLNAAGPEGTDP